MHRNKWIYWTLLFVFILPILACKLPFFNQDEESTFTLPPGQALYNNGIIEIMLPDTYTIRDIRTDIPAIRSALEFFDDSSVGVSVENLIEDLLKNAVFWAVDGDATESDSTRLLIVKNKIMANIPLGLITSTIESLFSIPEDKFDTEKLKLGDHDVVRLTLSQKSSGEAIYAVKDQSMMWLIFFITTPEQMPFQLSGFEESVKTFKIISIPLED